MLSFDANTACCDNRSSISWVVDVMVEVVEAAVVEAEVDMSATRNDLCLSCFASVCLLSVQFKHLANACRMSMRSGACNKANVYALMACEILVRRFSDACASPIIW